MLLTDIFRTRKIQ